MHQVYIVEDHPLVREMLSLLVQTMPEMQVCGAAESGTAALEEVPQVKPDLVLVDISMPDMDGIEVVERLKIMCPELKALVVSGHAEAVYAERAVRAGARGYYVKGGRAPLAEAVQAVLSGDIYRAAEAV